MIHTKITSCENFFCPNVQCACILYAYLHMCIIILYMYLDEDGVEDGIGAGGDTVTLIKRTEARTEEVNQKSEKNQKTR